MATPWATLATTLWPLSDLWKRLEGSALRYTLSASSDEARDAIVDGLITIAIDNLRKRAILALRKKYPSTAQGFLSLQLAKIREYQSVRDQIMREQGATDLSLADQLTWLQTIGMIPASQPYYVTTTTPTSATYAGVAPNGAFLVKEPVEALYINRGTLATPTWVEFNADALIDYITNPSELIEAGWRRIIEAIYEYGELNDSGNYDKNFEIIAKVIENKERKASKEEAVSLELLLIDASGDGLIDMQERSTSEANQWVF